MGGLSEEGRDRAASVVERAANMLALREEEGSGGEGVADELRAVMLHLVELATRPVLIKAPTPDTGLVHYTKQEVADGTDR